MYITNIADAPYMSSNTSCLHYRHLGTIETCDLAHMRPSSSTIVASFEYSAIFWEWRFQFGLKNHAASVFKNKKNQRPSNMFYYPSLYHKKIYLMTSLRWYYNGPFDRTIKYICILDLSSLRRIVLSENDIKFPNRTDFVLHAVIIS